MDMIMSHNRSRTLLWNTNCLMRRFYKKKDLCIRRIMENGQWKQWDSLWEKKLKMKTYLKTACIFSRYAHGISAYLVIIWVDEESISYLLSSKEMMVRLIVTSGSSRAFASISSQSTASCWISVQEPMITQSVSSTNTCSSMTLVEAAVVKSK